MAQPVRQWRVALIAWDHSPALAPASRPASRPAVAGVDVFHVVVRMTAHEPDNDTPGGYIPLRQSA